MRFFTRKDIRTKFYFSNILLLLISSILFITFSSKEMLACNSMIGVDNIAPQKFSSDSLFDNSIYSEDDIIRSGNTLFVNDTSLFLIENWYDLEIYNISNVNKPEKSNNYSALDVGYNSKMLVQNNFIYIYCENTDILHVLDCSDPMFIYERTRYTDFEGLENFAINDWCLYTLSEDSFTIYNFENFSNLVQLDNYSNNTYSFHDFTIKGNFSYVLDENKGFIILNITDYSNIQYIDEILMNEDEFKSAIYINNDNLFLFDSNIGLHIYDISSPLTIIKNSLFELTDIIAADVFVKENILFLLENDGLIILDASDLGQIQSISNYTVTDFYTSFDSFIIQNDFAYLHNTYRAHFEPRTPIFIVNITDLETPLHIYPVDEEDFWDWLDRLANATLAIAIILISIPLIGVTTFLIVFFIKKKKKSVNESKMMEQ